jgi:hypothetical protein
VRESSSSIAPTARAAAKHASEPKLCGNERVSRRPSRAHETGRDSARSRNRSNDTCFRTLGKGDRRDRAHARRPRPRVFLDAPSSGASRAMLRSPITALRDYSDSDRGLRDSHETSVATRTPRARVFLDAPTYVQPAIAPSEIAETEEYIRLDRAPSCTYHRIPRICNRAEAYFSSHSSSEFRTRQQQQSRLRDVSKKVRSRS